MQKNYILDTNILIHDPQSIFSFQDNNLYVPIYVLEELDRLKSEQSLRGRNSREACRLIDDLRCAGHLAQGVDINEGGKFIVYVPTERMIPKVAIDMNNMDNAILQAALDIKSKSPEDMKTILVTMDINLRIRADSLGVPTESYESSSVDINRMRSGYQEIEASDDDINDLFANKELGVESDELVDNTCVMLKAGTRSALCRFLKDHKKMVPLQVPKEGVMGIKPRNREQGFALDMLLDDELKLMTLVGMAGTGKAQPLSADVLTPAGYVKMGDLKIGTFVSVPSGGSAPILGIFPQGKKEIFRITFSDGTSTLACDDHLWLTQTSIERNQKKNGKIRSTSEIRKSLRYRGKKNHSIPITAPIEMISQNLIIDPYVFGLLLGDGTFRHHIGFSTSDNELKTAVNNAIKPQLKLLQKSKYDYTLIGSDKIINGHSIKSTINGVIQKVYTGIKECVQDGYNRCAVYKSIKNKTIYKNINWSFGNIVSSSDFITYLKNVGLIDKSSSEKFIPDDFKFSSIKDRIALLQGLMDTDGSVDSRTGKDFEFTTTSPFLADDFKWLIQSLGGTVSISTRRTKYKYNKEQKTGLKSYRLRLSLPNSINPFKLKRKSSLVKNRTKYFPRRYIVSVESYGFEQCQCILIDHPDHLYLTNDCIVTHNTLLAVAAGLQKVVVEGIYSRLVISRPVVPMGKDIGFLPGTLEEKMNPWMQPIFDNLELLMMIGGGKKKTGLMYDDLFDQDLIRVEPLTYIRGRSLPNQFIIIDESQNLSPHEVKTIVTRCGEGTKIVLTGDPDQIDNPYMDKGNCGLSVAVEKLQDNPLVGHLILSKGERSELANLAATKM